MFREIALGRVPRSLGGYSGLERAFKVESQGELVIQVDLGYLYKEEPNLWNLSGF